MISNDTQLKRDKHLAIWDKTKDLNSIINTFETHQPKINKSKSHTLEAICNLFNHEKRHYLVKYNNDEISNRKAYWQSIGQPFNYLFMRGIEQEISGMLKSIDSNKKNRLVNFTSKLDDINAEIKKLNKDIKKKYDARQSGNVNAKNEINQLKNMLHKKHIARATLLSKQNEIKRQVDEKDYSVCFGGKTLLRKRNKLESTNTEQLSRFRKEWDYKRNNTFVIVGDGGDVAGNRNAQLKRQEDGLYTLNIRVPYALEKEHGAHLQINDISISHGEEYIRHALLSTQNFRNIYSKLEDKSTIELPKYPLTYRFKRTKKGAWRLYIAVKIDKELIITNKKLGVIGIDINPDHLAVIETDHHGNMVKQSTLALPLSKKSSDQRMLIIHEQLNELICHASMAQKPIVMEKLDFKNKKNQLKKNGNKEYARMLSAFAYGSIQDQVISKCHKNGIELIHVNPIFTSQIGALKYANKYNISVHHAAALVIARRGMGIKEKKPKHLIIKKTLRQTKKTLGNTSFYLVKPSPVDMCLTSGKEIATFFRWKNKSKMENDGILLSSEDFLLSRKRQHPIFLLI